jgi:hypothetical protein
MLLVPRLMRFLFGQVDRTNSAMARADFGLVSTSFYMVLAAVVFYFSFAQHPDCLFTGTDGNVVPVLMNAERIFRNPFSQLGVSPVEGNFDAYFPLNRDYLVAETVGRIFAGGMPSKPLTFAACSMFLVVCGYALARAVGTGRAIALTTGLLIPITIMPLFQGEPTLLYSVVFNINPYFTQGIGISALIIGALWQLRGRWDAASLGWMAVLLACVVITMTSQPQTAAVMVPPVAVYGAASLFHAKDWRQNVQRLIAGALVLLVAFVIGFFQYELGLVKYTAYYFFGHEFEPGRYSMYLASMIFQGPTGVIVACLAYLGALYSILFESRALRILGIVFLGSTTFFLALASAVVAWVPEYQGPAPAYFESYFLPMYLLFAVVAVFRSFSLLGTYLMPSGISVGLLRFSFYLLTTASVVAVAGWNVANASVPDQRHCRLGGLPIRATSITDYLVPKIASATGQDFRGLVATFNSYIDQAKTSMSLMKENDSNLWVLIGNDHRDAGLWKFQIPTLLQYSPFTPPPYYLMLTEFVSRPTDLQIRNWIALTRINEPMLKLWGVRYLITDFDPGVGSPILEMKVPDARDAAQDLVPLLSTRVAHPSRMQLLTELDAPDLGDYSPTEFRRVDDFASGLAIMRDSGFDGRHTVVTDIDLGDELAPATASRLVLTKSGFRIQSSGGRQSVLVLPVQYSHCWAAQDPRVQLFRANLMQLGVRFAGALDTELVFRFGPIFAGGCRLEDANDMDRLKMAKARTH